MAWFRRKKGPGKSSSPGVRRQVPEGLWVKCEACKEIVYSKDLDKNFGVCPKCDFHFRIDAPTRIRLLLDEPAGDIYPRILPADPLRFADSQPYRDRLRAHRERLGVDEAAVVVDGLLEGRKIVLAVKGDEE